MQTEVMLNDNEKEKCLLNCLLIDNSIMDMLAGFPEDAFFNKKHKYIYKKMCELWKKNHFFDATSLVENESEFDLMYLATLSQEVPSTGAWEYYSKNLKELHKKRLILKLTSLVQSSAKMKSSSELISEIQAQLSLLDTTDVDCFDMKTLAISAVEEVQKAFKEKRQLLGYSCGFDGLDEIIDGIQEDNMYVLGARPSIGKTAFALALMMGIASKGVKTSVCSLEMSALSLFFRMISAKSDIPMWQIKKGIVNESSSMINRFNRAVEQLYSLPISIMDSGIDNDKILYSRIRYEAKVKGSKVIFIDHLGLIEVSDSSGQRYVDVGRITKTLHKMTRELHVAIVLLAQCGREAEGKKPNLALLRESGNIEQDADVIMLLHRQRELDDERERDNPLKMIPTDVIVAKNRDGKTGVATFSFKPICMNFAEDKNRSALDDLGARNERVKQQESKCEKIRY